MGATTPFRFVAPLPRLTTADEWAKNLAAVEDAGYYAVAVSEHYTSQWMMDAWTAASYALASTSTLRVFTLVLNNDFHHPAMLAKALATASALSGDRIGLGIGAGWLPDDYDRLGLPFDGPGRRLERLEEALTVIEEFFVNDTVTFDGQHYTIDHLEALPKVSRPPILVGAGGPKALGIAARHADIVGLHPRMRPDGFDALAAEELGRDKILEKINTLRTASGVANRPMPDLQFTCYDVTVNGVRGTAVRPGFTDFIERYPELFADSPGSLRGDVDKCVDDLLRWREEFGISYWNLGSNLELVAPIVSRLSGQ